jgi:hypothetical protein
VVDPQEVPAVPPFDPKGDVRLGYYAAGGTLIALGWGLAVVVNLLLHRLAPPGGFRFLDATIGPGIGPYAWGTVALGLVTGGFGVVLIALGRDAPPGPFVLPGYEYGP